MLRNKDPLFLKRTVDMIINWQRKNHSEKIIHIHGNADNTLPIRNVRCDHVIEHGSHMMILTEGEKLNELIINFVIQK